MTMFYAAVAWHVFDLTGSALQLGVLGLVRFVPHAALSLIGGAVADAFERRRIVMLSQCAPLLGASLLCTSTQQGSTTLLLLYAMVFLSGVAAAFESPARAA